MNCKIRFNTHVLHVVPGLMPGGMELGMANVISGLSGNGMRHSIVCLKGEPQIAERLPESAEIHCLHSYPNELKLPGRLARLIRQVRPSVIHARNWGAWPEVSVGRFLTWPAPLILSFHGLGQAGYMPLRRRAASWALARMATGLFTVSNQSRELMTTRWGWPQGKTQVISNGVDTDRFHPARHVHDRKRVVIGTVGNLRPVKNHALLIQACGDLVRRGVELEVRIAGEGELRANTIALAASLGLADRLKLLGRVNDVPAFLQDLDLFVLTSDSEQHPNALNEAMACGLPCVSTRVGCVDELLEEGRCGKIVPPGDRDQLTATIDQLISDPASRLNYGSAARDQACQHYSLKKMLAAYDSLYGRFRPGVKVRT